MNPEIKAQWVAALRSGEYKQGRGALACDGRHCCMGVLSEMAADAGVVSRVLREGSREYLFDGQDALLPIAVAAWAELTEEETLGTDERTTIMLPVAGKSRGDKTNIALANDDGVTFDQIADLIEYAL